MSSQKSKEDISVTQSIINSTAGRDINVTYGRPSFISRIMSDYLKNGVLVFITSVIISALIAGKIIVPFIDSRIIGHFFINPGIFRDIVAIVTGIVSIIFLTKLMNLLFRILTNYFD